MRDPASNRSAGFALLESMVALTLFTAFIGGAIVLSNIVGRSYRTESVALELSTLSSDALGQIAHRLRSSDAQALTPPFAAGVTTDTVDYLEGLGFDGAGVLWGPPEQLTFEYDPGDPDDGVDNDGDGLVDEGRVVWIRNPGIAGEVRSVLCNHVTEDFDGETPGNLVDDNGNGLVDEGGLCFEYQEGRVVAHLSLARMGPEGRLMTKTARRTIALRNTPEGAP